MQRKYPAIPNSALERGWFQFVHVSRFRPDSALERGWFQFVHVSRFTFHAHVSDQRGTLYAKHRGEENRWATTAAAARARRPVRGAARSARTANNCKRKL